MTYKNNRKEYVPRKARTCIFWEELNCWTEVELPVIGRIIIMCVVELFRGNFARTWEERNRSVVDL